MPKQPIESWLPFHQQRPAAGEAGEAALGQNTEASAEVPEQEPQRVLVPVAAEGEAGVEAEEGEEAAAEPAA